MEDNVPCSQLEGFTIVRLPFPQINRLKISKNVHFLKHYKSVIVAFLVVSLKERNSTLPSTPYIQFHSVLQLGAKRLMHL